MGPDPKMRTIGSIIRDTIRKPVGNALDNDPDDVVVVKEHLFKSGDLEEPKEKRNGYVTRDMDGYPRGRGPRGGCYLSGYAGFDGGGLLGEIKCESKTGFTG